MGVTAASSQVNHIHRVAYAYAYARKASLAWGQRRLPVLKQGIPGLGISVEQGTPSVPDDGKYYVLEGTDVVFSSASKSRALGEYRKRRESLLESSGRSINPRVEPEEVLRREVSWVEAEKFLGNSYAERRRRGMRKGGKAGRQGYK